jgi:hypothetical protein
VVAVSGISKKKRDSQKLCEAIEGRIRTFREENLFGHVPASPQASYVPVIVREEAERLGIQIPKKVSRPSLRHRLKLALATLVAIRDLPRGTPLSVARSMAAKAVADCGAERVDFSSMFSSEETRTAPSA